MPIRTAVLGFGRAGQLHHALQTASSPDYSLDAIVTAHPERAGLAGRRYPQAAVLASAEDVWARSDDFDLVIIATPNITHVPLAMEAVRRGIAVAIDKPIASGAAEASRLLDAADRADVPVTVFQNRRWDGDFLTVRDIVESGRIGEIHDFESRFTWWEPNPEAGWKTRTPVREGGGTLYDLGPHLIDQAVLLFGPVERWHAEFDVRRPGVVSPDDALLTLTHRSGVRSRLWMSCATPLSASRFRLNGSLGGFTKNGLDPQEAQAEAGLDPADPRFGIDDPAAWGLIGTDGATTPVETARGDYAAFYRQLAPALRGEGELPVDPRDSLDVLALIEEISGTGEHA
jgi:predicted dehydrogenase